MTKFLQAISLSLFLLLPSFASAQVAISELLWMGSDLSSADEWIEVARTDSGSIVGSGSILPLSLSGWTLTSLNTSGQEETMMRFGPDALIGSGTFLISNYDATHSRLGVEPNLVTTAVSLPNTKLLLRLRDAEGYIIDEAGDGSASPFAGENTAVRKASMERIDPWASGADRLNWRTSTGSIGFDADSLVFGTPNVIHWSHQTTEEVWSNTSESTSASSAHSSSISSLSGSLLSTGSGEVITGSGAATGSSSSASSAESSVNSSSSASSASLSPSFIRITEVLADPMGVDDHEWVEIGNLGDAPFDILGWILTRQGSTASYQLPVRGSGGYLLAPGEHIRLSKQISGISLPNDGGRLLLSSSGAIVHELMYPALGEDVSFGHDGRVTGADIRFCVATPGEANREIPFDPAITIQSGQLSGVAPLSLNLQATVMAGSLASATCRWDFGDGSTNETCNPPSHSFQNPGNYSIDLSIVTQCDNTVTRSLALTIQASSQASSQSTPRSSASSRSSSSVAACVPQSSLDVVIQRILPNPIGNDEEAEEIALRNRGSTDASLCGWTIDDEEGGSSPFSLDGMSIKAGMSLVLSRSRTKIALNNDADTVRLIGPAGESVESVPYEDAREALFYERQVNDSFAWSSDGQKESSSSSRVTERSTATVLRVLLPDQLLVRLQSQSGSTRTIVRIPLNDGIEIERALYEKEKIELQMYTENGILWAIPTQNGVDLRTLQSVEVPDETLSVAAATLTDTPIGDVLVRINEVFASTLKTGTDMMLKMEWVELLNLSSIFADLSGWLLDDVQGSGSKPWHIPQGTMIAPGEGLLLTKDQTKLALNDGGDDVALLAPNGDVMDHVSYPSLKAGTSYARLSESDGWCTTQAPTPGTDNRCVEQWTKGKKASSSSSKKAASKARQSSSPSSETGALTPLLNALTAQTLPNGVAVQPNSGSLLVWVLLGIAMLVAVGVSTVLQRKH